MNNSACDFAGDCVVASTSSPVLHPSVTAPQTGWIYVVRSPLSSRRFCFGRDTRRLRPAVTQTRLSAGKSHPRGFGATRSSRASIQALSSRVETQRYRGLQLKIEGPRGTLANATILQIYRKVGSFLWEIRY